MIQKVITIGLAGVVLMALLALLNCDKKGGTDSSDYTYRITLNGPSGIQIGGMRFKLPDPGSSIDKIQLITLIPESVLPYCESRRDSIDGGWSFLVLGKKGAIPSQDIFEITSEKPLKSSVTLLQVCDTSGTLQEISEVSLTIAEKK